MKHFIVIVVENGVGGKVSRIVGVSVMLFLQTDTWSGSCCFGLVRSGLRSLLRNIYLSWLGFSFVPRWMVRISWTLVRWVLIAESCCIGVMERGVVLRSINTNQLYLLSNHDALQDSYGRRRVRLKGETRPWWGLGVVLLVLVNGRWTVGSCGDDLHQRHL